MKEQTGKGRQKLKIFIRQKREIKLKYDLTAT